MTTRKRRGTGTPDTKRTRRPTGGPDVKRYASGGAVKQETPRKRTKSARTPVTKMHERGFSTARTPGGGVTTGPAMSVKGGTTDHGKKVLKRAGRMATRRGAKVAARAAGPVAGAAATGAAIGSKIYEKNAPRILDGIEKVDKARPARRK